MEMKLGMRRRGSYQFGDVSLLELAQKWPATRSILRRKLGSLRRAISESNMRKQRPQTLLTRGKPLGNKGYYIEPTIFTDVKDNMLIAQDEIFGPVMALMKFKTIEEAIQRENNTRYGLAAAIITEDLNVANTVSRSIRAGIIWINCYFAFDRDCPYGGDSGMQALYKYLHTKSVVTPIYNSPWL